MTGRWFRDEGGGGVTCDTDAEGVERGGGARVATGVSDRRGGVYAGQSEVVERALTIEAGLAL